MDVTPVRMERLRPDQLRARWADAPLVYVPIGCIEYHGPHLPLGVDGFTAHALCEDAAIIGGGVVHPISFMANGCLDLPYTITYPADVVEVWARTIILELHRRGAELVVLLTGHGPLDLIHLLKRVCGEFTEPGARAYGLCYLELNAARLTGPELGEPTVIDHASTVETSWMLAHHPELVNLGALPDDEQAKTIGVYGKNPRFTASADVGIRQRQQCAELLSERSAAIMRGTWNDSKSDLERFVDLVWHEPLRLDVEVVANSDAKIKLINPGRASRYITGVDNFLIDGCAVNLTEVRMRNSSVGEAGVAVSATNLGAEHGIYVRRDQFIDVDTASDGSARRPTSVEMTIELAGVRRQRLVWNRNP